MIVTFWPSSRRLAIRPPHESATSSGCGATKTWVMAGRVYRAATGRAVTLAGPGHRAAARADERDEHAGAVGHVGPLVRRGGSPRSGSWRSRGPTGMTSRAPSASWSRSASGRPAPPRRPGCRPTARRRASRGCRRPTRTSTAPPYPSAASRARGRRGEVLVALDGRHAAAERGEDGRLVARARADLEDRGRRVASPAARSCGRP